MRLRPRILALATPDWERNTVGVPSNLDPGPSPLFALRLILAAALAVLARVAPAQELRGTVADSASRAPVPGAVLLLLDATGRQLGRNITNERGQYRIALSAGMERLRVLRIGFRPRELTIPSPTDGVARLDIALASLPQLLEPVHIVDHGNCPKRADRETALALWEQARAGLLATVVAREANPARMTRLRYRQYMPLNRDVILAQTVFADTGQSTTSFAARYTTSEFLRAGFIVESDSATQSYYGPDAEVLLDEGFTAGYCLAIADRDRSRGDQVGVRFFPATRQRGRVDIDGALWIDTVARALRSIEFRYLGLDPRADQYRPGGQIEFREMANGVVVIDRWWLRMTGAKIASASPPLPQRYEISHGGGELAHATWPDGQSWNAPLGTLRLQVVDHKGAPAPATMVLLDSTDYFATTGADGRLEIGDLLPGPYTVSFVDSTLATIGMVLPARFRFIAQRESTYSARVVARSAADSVAHGCDERRTFQSGSYMLVGRIENADGAPAAKSEWVVKDLLVNQTFGGRTGSDGLFFLCKGLSRGSQLQLRAWRHRDAMGVEPPTIVQRSLVAPLTAIRLQLPPR